MFSLSHALLLLLNAALLVQIFHCERDLLQRDPEEDAYLYLEQQLGMKVKNLHPLDYLCLVAEEGARIVYEQGRELRTKQC